MTSPSMEDDVDKLRTMNALLSERLDKGIQLLTKQLLETPEGQMPDEAKVHLALAAMKQVLYLSSRSLSVSYTLFSNQSGCRFAISFVVICLLIWTHFTRMKRPLFKPRLESEQQSTDSGSFSFLTFLFLLARPSKRKHS